MEAEVGEVAVVIPSALRALCAGQVELRLAAPDLGALFEELRRLHPEVHARLCDERGEPRPHLGVFVNDDHFRGLAGLNTGLKPGDVVTILPAVSGG
ncbi:MAG: MoaD/ThiS family protein [Pirellulales bacterium]